MTEDITDELKPAESLKFQIDFSGDSSAGLTPYSNTLYVRVNYDPGGEAGEFQRELGFFLGDWFDGATVSSENNIRIESRALPDEGWISVEIGRPVADDVYECKTPNGIQDLCWTTWKGGYWKCDCEDEPTHWRVLKDTEQ